VRQRLERALADDGELSEADSLAFERHAEEGCPACGEILEQILSGTETARWRKLLGSALAPTPIDNIGQATPSPLKEQTEPVDFPFPPSPIKGYLGQLGDYQIVRRLGGGAMGAVFLAEDMRMRRKVALKVPRPELGELPAFRERFEREARAAAAVHHPNVVTTYCVTNTLGFALPYLVMEYIDGQTVADRLRQGKALPHREAAEIAAQVAAALDAAHRQGLVLRDVKPSNIMLEKHGQVRITDFGLARAADGTDPISSPGAVVGTPSYMSPEQVQAPSRVDERSDLFSLGVVLYEMLTGERPFRGTAEATMFQVVNEEAVLPRRLQPQVPRDLETVCLKCLRKEPAKRYASAKALADDLGRFLRGEPVQARPISPWERTVKAVRRRPALAALVVVAALALTTVIGGALWHNAQLSAALWDIEKEQKQTQRQRDRARDRLIAEAGIVNKFLSKVTDSPEMKARGVEPLRKQLLAMAIQYYEELVREQDSEPRMQAERGRAYGRLAVLLQETGNPAGAESAFGEALAIAERLAHAYPAEARYQSLLGEILHNLAGFYAHTNRPELAEPHYLRAIDIWDVLWKSSPGEARYAAGVHSGHTGLGLLYRQTNRKLEALAASEKALQIAEEIAMKYPRDDKLQESLALCHNNLATLLGAEFRDVDKEKDHLLSAVRIWEGLVAKDKTVVSYRSSLALGLQNLGIGYLAAHQLKDATAFFERSREIWTGLRNEHRTVTRYAVEQGGASCNLGEIARISGDFSTAAVRYGDAVDILKNLLAEFGPNERARGYLLSAYAARAETLTHLKRCEEADRDWAEAMKLDDHRRYRAKLQAFRALTLAVSGKHAEATAAALALAKKEKTYGEIHFVAARVCSVAARDVAEDMGLPAEERTQKVKQYVSDGLSSLTKARELGFFRVPANCYSLRVLSDLNTLRPHDEFQALLAQVDKE
jgi:serine/threonine-protein kinase